MFQFQNKNMFMQEQFVQYTLCLQLMDDWDKIRRELMDFHMSTITTYTQNARYLAAYEGN